MRLRGERGKGKGEGREGEEKKAGEWMAAEGKGGKRKKEAREWRCDWDWECGCECECDSAIWSVCHCMLRLEGHQPHTQPYSNSPHIYAHLGLTAQANLGHESSFI